MGVSRQDIKMFTSLYVENEKKNKLTIIYILRRNNLSVNTPKLKTQCFFVCFMRVTCTIRYAKGIHSV